MLILGFLNSLVVGFSGLNVPGCAPLNLVHICKEMQINLVSVSKLTELGFINIFIDNLTLHAGNNCRAAGCAHVQKKIIIFAI